MESLDQQIEQAAKLIREANNIVAMTGAGISTPSGIPDFRSANSGLWDRVDPLSVASIFAFRQNPQAFFDWIRPLAPTFFSAEPNPAHYALAALEKAGKIKTIITQNIDDLHGKAGSQKVIELHGHLREATCIRCYALTDAAPLFEKFLDDGQIPKHQCGGVFKPNIILFGEQLPAKEFVAAQLAVKAADLLLVVGSSLEVAPASDLPELALDHGAKVVIINYQPTNLDSQADVVINADIAAILPRVAQLVTV
jgi:NAD-dependent deacetylase